jgi:hypothetical protein
MNNPGFRNSWDWPPTQRRRKLIFHCIELQPIVNEWNWQQQLRNFSWTSINDQVKNIYTRNQSVQCCRTIILSSHLLFGGWNLLLSDWHRNNKIVSHWWQHVAQWHFSAG